jgi:hypothetical protein
MTRGWNQFPTPVDGSRIRATHVPAIEERGALGRLAEDPRATLLWLGRRAPALGLVSARPLEAVRCRSSRDEGCREEKGCRGQHGQGGSAEHGRRKVGSCGCRSKEGGKGETTSSRRRRMRREEKGGSEKDRGQEGERSAALEKKKKKRGRQGRACLCSSPSSSRRRRAQSWQPIARNLAAVVTTTSPLAQLTAV